MRALKVFVLPLSEERRVWLRRSPGVLLVVGVLLVAIPVALTGLVLGALGISGPLILAALVAFYTFGVRVLPLPVGTTVGPSDLDPQAQMVLAWMRNQGERRYLSTLQLGGDLHLGADAVEATIATLRDRGLAESTVDGTYHRAL